jgi:hypothetical protein
MGARREDQELRDLGPVVEIAVEGLERLRTR